MSSAGSARVPKRRRTTKTSEAADRQLRERQFLDLNLFPAVEVASTGGSLSINEPVSRTQPPPTAAALLYETTQVMVSSAVAESNIGMNSFPINVEVIDDDVAIYTSGPPPQVCSLCLVLIYVLHCCQFQLHYDCLRRSIKYLMILFFTFCFRQDNSRPGQDLSL